MYEFITKVDPKYVVLGGAVAGSLLLGGGAGYLVAVKRLNKQYDERLIQELQETKEFIQFTMDEDEKDKQATPENINLNEYTTGLEQAARSVVNYAGVESNDDEIAKALETLDRMVKDSTDEAVVVVEDVNVFDMDVTVWDLDKEMAQRDPLQPYIISEDEFMQNDPEHEQVQVTYYQGDDILSDAKDEPIPDVNGTVGEDNLTRFGHGSDNANMVFVRNEVMATDFEIERSFGNFAEEVHGIIKHSQESRKARRYRGDDE
jgi:hypothetical protein